MLDRELLRIIREIDACTSDSILEVGDEGTVQIPLHLLRGLKRVLRDLPADEHIVGKGEFRS